MSTALIVEPPLRLSRDFIDTPYFVGLGAYQAAAVLRDHGWQVAMADGLAHSDADWSVQSEVAWLGQPADAYLDRVAHVDADLVLVHATPYLLNATGRPWLERLVAALRQGSNAPLVLADLFVGGMHHLEYDARALLRELPGVARVLRYECEPLLERLVRDGPPASGAEPDVWENREPFSLDRQPAPAYDLLDAPAYFAFLQRTLGAAWRPGPIPADPERTLPLVTARGCPFGCVFCSRNPGLPGDRRQWRAVPVPRVDAWVRDWVARFDLQRLVLLDEVVNLRRDRFDALLDVIARLHLRVDLPNGLRADQLTEDQVRRLARLTSRIKVSLESASRRVQDEVLDKRLDPSSVERVAGWCQRYGLELDVHCLIGIPGETGAELRSTLELAARLYEEHGARPLLQYATPLPGTRLAELHGGRGRPVPTPDDLSAAFQQRGVLTTEHFTPDLLDQARTLLERRTRPARARKVIVNLTYECNNHCVFCAVGDRPRRHADVADVLAALERYREQGYELVDFDGGEPTLNDGLPTVVRGARRLGYRRITVVTNGRRCKYPAYAKQLAEFGVDEVLVSLHAPDAATHDRLSSVAGSYEQTVAGLQNLLDCLSSAEQVAVNTTVVADNVASLAALGQQLSQWGVRRWNLQVVTPFGRAQSAHLPTPEALQTHVGAALRTAPPGLAVAVVNCPPCLLPGHELVAVRDQDKAVRDMVFVGESGENLLSFLAQRRQPTERCEACLFALACPGEYVFDGPADPPFELELAPGDTERLALRLELKPVLREVIDAARYPGWEAEARRLGLSAVRGAAGVGEAPGGGGLSWRPQFKESQAARVIAYAGRERPLLERARDLDVALFDSDDPEVAASLHRELGVLLGYPPCCVEAFAAYDGRQPDAGRIQAAAGRSRGFEPLLNNSAPSLFRYLAWYPCRYDCAASLSLAQQLDAALKEESPRQHERVWRLLRMPRLYLDDRRQVLFDAWEVDRSTVRYRQAFTPATFDRRSDSAALDRNWMADHVAPLVAGDTLRVDGDRAVIERGGQRVGTMALPPLATLLPFGFTE